MNERPYEPADLPSVIETYTASIRVLAAPYYTSEQIAAWAPIPPDAGRWQASLPTRTSPRKLRFLHARRYLDILFTHPAFARHGVASSLYRCVESALRAVNTPKVTTLASLAARPFFDRYGFQLDSEECVECRGAYLRRFVMHKQLRNERIA